MESLNFLRYLVLRDNILRNTVSQIKYNSDYYSGNYFGCCKSQAVLPDTFRQGCGEKYAGSKTNILQSYVCASAYQDPIIVQKWCHWGRSRNKKQKVRMSCLGHKWLTIPTLKYLNFVLIEAKDAARATRLVKSIKMKHEKVSHIPPEVQHQV